MYPWELQNADGAVLSHSPTVRAAIHTAKAMFGVIAAKPNGKTIVLYDSEAKICAIIRKKSKAASTFDLKKQRQSQIKPEPEPGL